MSKELSQEMINAIDNYSGQIKTLKDFVTAVRKMPGMYVAGTGDRAYLSMIREIFQNAVDQVILESSPADKIQLYYNENTCEIRVEDNGLGLPFNDIARILTTPNTSKNYEKHQGEYSSGLHGAGIKCCNALSSNLIAESYRYDGTAVRFETVEGYPITGENPKAIPNKNKKQGTMIWMIPCTEILGEIHLSWKAVYKLVKQIISRTPIGSVVDFTAVDLKGISFEEHIVNKDGIVADLIEKSSNPISKPISVFADNGYMKLEAAFVFDGGGEEGPNPVEQIVSFCNFCPCPIGTHNNGTVDGITRWFTRYMNNIYLNSGANTNSKKKTKSLSVVSSDIKAGLIISINAALLEPVFIGQAKEQLANTEMEQFCRETVMAGLDVWAKSNPTDLIKLCKYFKDIAELRIKESGEKSKIVSKYQQNVMTGLPQKYYRPLKKDNIELIIVEGDSACGTVLTGRDKNTQGVFPIRGKIINAFQASKSAFFANEEVQSLNKIILGTDYKRNFTIEECKVSKVIFMADADVDRQILSLNAFRKTMRVY